ncbi:fatty acid desaturase family protein [Larkinella insperata]|uniref:Fatty acid desaturase family protein n=1 Tax=Larkinella insperata TaxID=332158 RepID=A0ABW3QHV5_9BACT|nr:fatty acid desaturase [Larkinella insperata]
MRVLPAIQDPTSVAQPSNTFDRFLARFIRDPRDLPFVHLTLRITLTLIPLGILLFIPAISGWVWWMIAVAYLVTYFIYKGPFGLMGHCAAHRPLFKREYRLLSYYMPTGMALFFGMTPETYVGHHIGMHHPENNMPEDLSTTMPYQRDSVKGFLHYLTTFLFTGVFTLIGYLRRKNRQKMAIKAMSGEISFAVMCGLLLWLNAPATIVVFLIPFVFTRIISMIGNWTQHAFVDSTDPANAYKNSITCINVKYNRLCWNDGYHISHHCRPAMHWSEHPHFFMKTIDQYASNKAIIFDGLDFGQVFFLLMKKRYDRLAQHVVNVNGTFQNEQEIIELMKYRLQPIREWSEAPVKKKKAVTV